ncbi:MAG: DUF488 family protein, partial [Acidimicrobiia bacterium]
MGETAAGADLKIFTVGHSTHDLTVFLELLKRHGVERLVDVRVTPKSRRLPHFNLESLEKALPREGIEYLHLKELGGRRKASPGSVNGAWEV